jgi:hypothetical protein
MVTPVSLDEQVIRGHKASQVLENSLVIEAFAETRKAIMTAWEQTPARDVEAREFLFKLNQASLRFEDVFKGYIDSGKVAAAKLKEQSLFGKLKSVI